MTIAQKFQSTRLASEARSKMGVSESRFIADALEQGREYIRSKARGRKQGTQNKVWSEFCQSLLTPADISGVALKAYVEQLTTIERIYSASLVYALAQPKIRRKSLAMYFTPPPLSEYVLDRAESLGANFAKHHFIDPAAGGASFIGPIANRMSERGATPEQIAENLKGVEIDAALADFARTAARHILKKPADHLVTCGNGLVHGEAGSFDVVIGNPPYRVLSPSQRKEMPSWAKPILGNYANLYSLFIMRGLHLLREGGLLAFLVPTSFVAGNYFRPLRKYVSQHATILAIDMVEQRREFFRNVSQDVCLFVCRKTSPGNKSYIAEARTVDRDICWRDEASYYIHNSSGAPWLRASQQNVQVEFDTIESLGYTVRCGPIVHNRDKGLSEGIRRRRKEAVPLVWGHVIRPFSAVQPASRSRKPGDGAITFVSTRRNTPPVTVPAIVLQRTNSGDQEKRIRAGIVEQSWIDKYGGFYGENHVVVIAPDPSKKQRCSLNVLLRVLSTSAVDRRLRQLLSSNSVNVTALRALEIPKFSEQKFDLINCYSDTDLEAAIEEAYR